MARTDARLRALIVQHEEPTPAGVAGDWLRDRRADVDVFRIDLEDRDPDPREYDLVVSLGSQYAAFDDSIPWIDREKRLLGAAMEGDVPVLGLCFGGQLLARVLGGECFRSERSEVGWLPVRSRDPELVPEGPWFQWHFDSFTLPDGAELIADSDAGPQAFSIGRGLGVQFHPEITPDIVDDAVRVYAHELEEVGVHPAGLLDESRRRAQASRQNALGMFERFAAGLARLPGPDRDGKVRG